MYNEYLSCKLCPRECKTDRINGNLGYCLSSAKLFVAKAYPHKWEEPCLSGTNGSGTVFFSGCNLRCVFCQNSIISTNKVQGKEITAERLSDIFIELEQMGVHNINLVTPTHFMPHIKESIKLAKANGIKIPFVYNTSGYEKAEIIKHLSGYIDIYLTDMKYCSNAYAKRYSNAPNYFSYAFDALKAMYKQTGNPVFDENGILKRGTIVRHLIMPDMVTDSKRVLQALFNEFNNNIIYSIMNQFTPISIDQKYDEINRKITDEEYNEVLNFADSIGITNGFTQVGDTASDSFIPSFDLEGV